MPHFKGIVLRYCVMTFSIPERGAIKGQRDPLSMRWRYNNSTLPALSVVNTGYKHSSPSEHCRVKHWLLLERRDTWLRILKTCKHANWTLDSNCNDFAWTQHNLLPSTNSPPRLGLFQRVDAGGRGAGAGQPELQGGLALPQHLLLLVLKHQDGLPPCHGELRGEGGLPHWHPQPGGEHVPQEHLNGDRPRGVPQSYLTLKWQILHFFLYPGILFVVPKEEHLMMVLFSSYGWYPEYRVVPETSGLPEISGNTRCFGLPATRWFLKLNRVGSGIERNTG